MTRETLTRSTPSLRLADASATVGIAATRIAIVFQDFAAGGTERIMVRLANEWAREREVMILCGSEQGPARAQVSAEVVVAEVSPSAPRSAISRWKIGRRMRPILDAWRPDVIVGPGNHVLPIFMASRVPSAPIVCKLSNPIDLGDLPMVPSPLLARARRKACAPLSRIIAMSPALCAEAAGYLGTDRVTVISEPILSELTRIDRRRRSADMRLIFAGRLVAQKNVALALRTLAVLPDGFTLTIVGDGPERPRLEALTRRLGLTGRVTFTGLVSDIRPYLEASDLFILPSRFEGYPAVLIEALAAGLPVVATPSSPAMGEILIDRSFGRIARADPIALATAIMSYEGCDGPNPERLRPMLEQHLLETCASRWLETLDAVVLERRECSQ